MIEIEKLEPKPMTAAQCRPLVPVRVVELRALIAGGEHTPRFDAVKGAAIVGDVCVVFEDHGTHCARILHCRSGVLFATWFADFLLFEYPRDVRRVVIAKPEN